MVANRNFVLPSIKLTDSQKKVDDYRAVKLLADHYLGKAERRRQNSEFPRLRRLATNEVVEEDYKTMLKKYNYEKLNTKKAAGYIKSMPLTSSIMRMLKGEKRIAPLNFHTKSNNEDVENRYLAELDTKVQSQLDQMMVNALNDNSVSTGVPSEETPDLQEAVHLFQSTYQDKRAMAGQEILDGIITEHEVKETFYKTYVDWISFGEAYTIKDIIKDDLDFASVGPDECYVEYSANSPYAEDGQAFAITRDWPIVDVIRKFGDELSHITIGEPEGKKLTAMEWLSSLVGLDGAGDPRPRNYDMKNETFESTKSYYDKVVNNPYYDEADRKIAVHYVVMNLLTPVKILTYKDELGLIQEKEVENDYEVNEVIGDISTEQVWVNDPWVVHKIGNGSADGDFCVYPRIERLYPSRSDINNSSISKLPINGRRDGLSIPKVLEDFQYKYNLVHLIEERTLAKDGGQPVIIPLSMIPNDPSWGTNPLQRAESLLYYRDTFNAIIVDDAKMNPHVAQMIKSVNMGTLDTMEKFIQLKEQIKADAWDAIGVNRQRQGETYASDGKATTEQALIRSSIMTADFNIAFNLLESKDLLGLLDYSKAAYINGKTFTKYPTIDDYFISDKTRTIYKVDPEEHCESQYGVTVSVTDLDNKKLDTIAALAQPFLQNGVAAPYAYKAVTSDNPTKAKNYLDKAYQVQVEHEDRIKQEDRESQERIAAENNAAQDRADANAMAIEQLKADVKLYEIDVDRMLQAAQQGDERQALIYKAAAENRQLDIDQQRVALDNRKVNNDFTIAKEANRIAKSNKATQSSK